MLFKKSVKNRGCKINPKISQSLESEKSSSVQIVTLPSVVRQNPYLIIGWEREVLGPGGIWGRVQGVGSDPWGTRSQP